MKKQLLVLSLAVLAVTSTVEASNISGKTRNMHGRIGGNTANPYQNVTSNQIGGNGAGRRAVHGRIGGNTANPYQNVTSNQIGGNGAGRRKVHGRIGGNTANPYMNLKKSRRLMKNN